MKNCVTQFLIVVGIDILELGEQPEPRGFASELMVNTEKKLREQFARYFAQISIVHLLSIGGITYVFFVVALYHSGRSRGERRIDSVSGRARPPGEPSLVPSVTL